MLASNYFFGRRLLYTQETLLVRARIMSTDWGQARSQAYLSGVAKFSWRKHVPQMLRAHLILYVVKLKWIMFAQEKIEYSSMLLRSRLRSTKISGDFPFSIKKQQQNIAKKFPGVAKSWHPAPQGWHLPPHDYGLD